MSQPPATEDEQQQQNQEALTQTSEQSTQQPEEPATTETTTGGHRPQVDTTGIMHGAIRDIHTGVHAVYGQLGNLTQNIGGPTYRHQQTLYELVSSLAPRTIKFEQQHITPHADDRPELMEAARRLGSRTRKGDQYFEGLVDAIQMVQHHPSNPSPKEAVDAVHREGNIETGDKGMAQRHLERYFQPTQAWTGAMQEYMEKHPMASMDDYNKANAIVRENMTFKAQNVGPPNVYQDQVSENMFKLAGVVGPHAQLPVSNYLEHEKKIFHDPQYVGPSDRFQMESKAIFSAARVNDHPLREKTIVYNDFDERHSQRHQKMDDPKREFQLNLKEHTKPFKSSKVPKPINPHKTEKQIKKTQTGSDFSKEDVPKNRKRRPNTQKLTKLGPEGHTMRHKRIRHPRPRAKYYDEL